MEKSKEKKVKSPKPPKPPKAPKPVLTERDLAMKQAAKMQKDMARLQATQSVDKASAFGIEKTAVDQWKDSDFFFSVVFQSESQKYLFLEFFSKKFNLEIEEIISDNQRIQIFNGIKLAEKIGLKIEPETTAPFPYPNLELAELALDAEEY